jgi:hypothetical protein
MSAKVEVIRVPRKEDAKRTMKARTIARNLERAIKLAARS